MRSDRLLTVRAALLFLLPWFAVGLANAQSKPPAPQITVYESPT
jgi:hypothetical protein